MQISNLSLPFGPTDFYLKGVALSKFSLATTTSLDVSCRQRLEIVSLASDLYTHGDIESSSSYEMVMDYLLDLDGARRLVATLGNL